VLTVDPHPLLQLGAFVTEFPAALGDLATPASITTLFAVDAAAPVQRTEARRASVRDLLRHGGYKPTGRGKPASEYLVRAATNGKLGTINLAVDACNAVSLQSGFPISLVDLDRTTPPLRVGIAAADACFVFNASGQEIALGGLLCLHDADGPCANAVKDSQRTKTSPETRRTLSLVWGCAEEADALDDTVAWYRALLAVAGAATVSD